MSSTCLAPFLSATPAAFGGQDLTLAAPGRGHTWTLRWQVTDGMLVSQGTVLWKQVSDADWQETHTFRAPLPARVTILQPSGRYLPPGVIGRLQYGEALEAALSRQWQELALDLAAALGRRNQLVPPPALSPRDLARFVYLERSLTRLLQRAGLCPVSPPVPDNLREDRAVAALEELAAWKAEAVREAGAALPEDITERTLDLWQYVFTNLIATLRSDGLAAEDGLDAE